MMHVHIAMMDAKAVIRQIATPRPPPIINGHNPSIVVLSPCSCRLNSVLVDGNEVGTNPFGNVGSRAVGMPLILASTLRRFSSRKARVPSSIPSVSGVLVSRQLPKKAVKATYPKSTAPNTKSQFPNCLVRYLKLWTLSLVDKLFLYELSASIIEFESFHFRMFPASLRYRCSPFFIFLFYLTFLKLTIFFPRQVAGNSSLV